MCDDGQAWKALVCFLPGLFPQRRPTLVVCSSAWAYFLLPAYRAPGLLGKLEVQWIRWTSPALGETAYDLSALHGQEGESL